MPDTPGHEKSGLGKLLFFVFGGIGLFCIGGLVLFGWLFNGYVDRCVDETSGQFIQDEIARAESCD